MDNIIEVTSAKPIAKYMWGEQFELNEKERSFFDKALGNNFTNLGTDLYVMVKRLKAKRVLEVGTGDWFNALAMALGGAWVVSLSDRPTSPGHYRVLNAYKDKVFQIIQKPRPYLESKQSKWDVIVLSDDQDPAYYFDKFTMLLVHGGYIYEKA